MWLEKCLEVAVQFNAASLWEKSWSSELTKQITNGGIPFSRFVFGHFVQSLTLLKNKGARFLRDMPDDTLKLLESHATKRNDFVNRRHDMREELPNFEVNKVASKIMYDLIKCLPTCIKITENKFAPMYEIEILWNKFPTLAILFSDKELKNESQYCIDPFPLITTSGRIRNSQIILPTYEKVVKWEWPKL